MRNPSSSRLFIGSGIISDMAMRSWWLAFVVFTVLELGLSPLQLVLLGTALEVTVLVSEIPTGVVADLYSRKWSVVLSFWLVGLGLAASGLFTGFGMLVATQVLWGFGFTFRSGADIAWITDEIGVEATERILIRRGKLQLAGSAAGLVLGAILANLTSVRTVIVTSGCILILWGGFLAVTMTEHAFERTRGDTWRSFLAELTDGAKSTWRRPPLKVLVLVMLAIGLASESIDRLGVRRLDQVGFAEQTNEILVLTLMGIGGAAIGVVLLTLTENRITGRSIPGVYAGFVAIAAICAALVSWAISLPVAIAALTLRDGTTNAGRPLVEAWTNAHATDKHRATTHSFIGQAEALGEMSGGIILGLVATGADVATAIGCSAALLAFAAVLSLRGKTLWS